MVKLVNSQQCIVKSFVFQFFHTISQGGMGANQYLRTILTEEFNETTFLVLFVFDVRQIEIRWYGPIGKEATIRQIGILKRAANTLFRHSHHNSLKSLILQLIKCNKHQCAALSRGWRCLNQKKTFVTMFVGHCLHLAHSQWVHGCSRSCLLILDINNRVFSF